MKTLLIIFIILLLVLISISLFMVFFSLRRDFKFQLPISFDEEKEEQLKFVSHYEGNIEKQERFKNIAIQKQIISDDGLKLQGWFLKNDSHKYVISCHGYKGEHTSMIVQALEFYDYGFNVLCPDARSHGLSEGNFIGMGALEKKDIAKWMKMIIDNDEDAKIVLYGVSMGAATVLMTMCHFHPNNLKCVIEDCGYYSVFKQFEAVSKRDFHMPAFPVLYIANIFTNILCKYDLIKSDIRPALKENEVPILFIHGDSDDFVPYHFVHDMYEINKGEKDIFVVEKAGHAFAKVVDEAGYRNKLKNFIEKYI